MIHVTTVRARYAETDRAGVVYHASYLYWFEVGRTEMMRDAGFPYGAFERERNLLLTVATAHAEYRSPTRYDDLVRVESWLTDVRRVGFTVRHRLVCDATGQLRATGYIRLACVDPSGRVRAVPTDVAAALAPWIHAADAGNLS